MREFSIIADYFAPLAHPEFGLGLKDDAALLDVPEGYQLCITTDTLSAGTHFIGNESPKLIAQKALRVSISDLASMGAKPWCYSLNIAAPTESDEAFFAAFANGLEEDQKAFGLSLVGGDTTSTSGPLTVTITAYGLVKKGMALTRSGAQLGDTIYVTGMIGAAALGLGVAKGDRAENAETLRAYQLPTPRIALAHKLAGTATACIDISDGLVQDLGHVCAASNVGADVHLDLIPLADKEDYRTCLTGGDDYELLFTGPTDINIDTDCNITCIGTIVEGKPRILDDSNAEITFEQKGFQHF